MSQLEDFIRQHRITEVECLVPDMAGIARGKILPAEKLLRILRDRGLRLPEAVFITGVTGDYPPDEDVTGVENSDVYMVPDESSVRLVPWYPEPTAQVICDCSYVDGRPVDISPRSVLRRVLEAYAEHGWQPIVAPELEFYLVKVNKDPDYPLTPPVGKSGRTESGRQAFGIDAVNEFDPLFEDVYDYCDAQDIDVDTLTHEAGAAQIEINFNHSDALSLADQVFMFKRTVRQAAIRHQVYATFMAKPMQSEPGSAMHIHQSVIDKNGQNIFAEANGDDSTLFLNHIAGLQTYLPLTTPLLVPYINSYRRLVQGSDAPINAHWGRDNRTTGFRVPLSAATDRRVENRIPGADANPYLAMAASLACGLLGMREKLMPAPAVSGSAHQLPFGLPRHHFDALQRLNDCAPLKQLLGERFVRAFTFIKNDEFAAFMRVISSWERENLLLNV